MIFGKAGNKFPLNAMLSLSRAIMDFIYPPYCFICKTLLREGSELICEGCWTSLTPFEKPDHESPPEVLLAPEELFFSHFLAVWQFDELVEKIIHLFKYEQKKSLSHRLGKAMSQLLLSHEGYRKADFLVPVPLHKTKLRERGYNQSLLLCQSISQTTGLEVKKDLVKRVRYTRSQATLGARERIKNVQHAFQATDTISIKNKVLILVDDVLTTGSTVNSCARELKRAGAHDVLVLTIAKA